jgi:N-glycosylase/DNA lyase
VAFGRAARLRRDGGGVFISGAMDDFENVWRDYFDLGRDYAEIRRRLCIDDFMRKASDFGAGIRILRQDRWEALCSFIISQCNNIPRIKKIISALCGHFGDRFEFEGKEYTAFPSASALATLNAEALAPIRCGYRAEYIVGAAKAVASGELDLDALALGSPEAARTALKKLRGVGDKVADCAVLFGLNMLDAFPLDVWMKRAVAQQYGKDFDPAIFSPYAGVAQQYIYYYARSGGGIV